MPGSPESPANRTSEPPSGFGVESSSDSYGAAVEEFLDEVGVETQPEGSRIGEGCRGRTALVTGGSSGIGRAIALAFGEAGANVAFNYLETGPDAREAAQQVAAELRELEVRVYFRPCDVRRPVDAGAFVEEVVGELGGIHFLVNNAGIGRDGALWRMTDESWEAVLDTNLSGAFYFIRAVAPLFRAQEWGKIVNVASIHGVRGEFGLANYMSSKAGLIGLTRSAAVELGPKNVNVNAVAPGYIRTTQLTEQVPAEIMDRARERSVLGRLGDPQDVARLVLFLCSEEARHITGAVIPVDGGYLI
jgi:3-oxoacyl-[acyl-carrier protein] reductase